jgi:hypothetical protein
MPLMLTMRVKYTEGPKNCVRILTEVIYEQNHKAESKCNVRCVVVISSQEMVLVTRMSDPSYRMAGQ